MKVLFNPFAWFRTKADQSKQAGLYQLVDSENFIRVPDIRYKGCSNYYSVLYPIGEFNQLDVDCLEVCKQVDYFDTQITVN